VGWPAVLAPTASSDRRSRSLISVTVASRELVVLATAYELGGGLLSYDERLARYVSVDDG